MDGETNTNEVSLLSLRMMTLKAIGNKEMELSPNRKLHYFSPTQGDSC